MTGTSLILAALVMHELMGRLTTPKLKWVRKNRP
jgi:hypothetical protein